MTKNGKLIKSIVLGVADKLDAKCKSLVKKASLFEKKQQKITLKYHEVWALYEALIELNQIHTNDYKRGLIQDLISKLHQKLI